MRMIVAVALAAGMPGVVSLRLRTEKADPRQRRRHRLPTRRGVCRHARAQAKQAALEKATPQLKVTEEGV